MSRGMRCDRVSDGATITQQRLPELGVRARNGNTAPPGAKKDEVRLLLRLGRAAIQPSTSSSALTASAYCSKQADCPKVCFAKSW